MFKKISIITFIQIANISLLFAQKGVYVISPAVGTHKDNALKESYVSTLSALFINGGYVDESDSLLGAIRDAAIDALYKSPDKNSQIAGKVLKARGERFIVMVAVDDLTEETCNKLGLKYNIVSKFADGVVTVTIFDKNNLTSLPYVNFKSVKLQNYEKVSKDLFKSAKKYLDKQIKQKK